MKLPPVDYLSLLNYNVYKILCLNIHMPFKNALISRTEMRTLDEARFKIHCFISFFYKKIPSPAIDNPFAPCLHEQNQAQADLPWHLWPAVLSVVYTRFSTIMKVMITGNISGTHFLFSVQNKDFRWTGWLLMFLSVPGWLWLRFNTWKVNGNLCIVLSFRISQSTPDKL